MQTDVPQLKKSFAKTCDLIPTSSPDALQPVSTDDLANFVYVPSTQNGQATVFRQVKNEQYYYHGRVYLRAVGSRWDSGTKLDLYLD